MTNTLRQAAKLMYRKSLTDLPPSVFRSLEENYQKETHPSNVVEAMREHACVHLVQVGGTPAFHRKLIEDKIKVYWEDLGLERVIEYKFKNFGPLVVSVDTTGRQIFKEESFKAQELHK